MKIIIAGIGIAAVVGVTVWLVPSETEVIKEEVIVEQTPEWAQDTDAVQAAQDVIRRKEIEARLEVLGTEIQERQSEIDELEKELGTY